MIEKEIVEKTVQWIKLEKEVMDTVVEKIENKEITNAEWARFFVATVKQYGNKNMMDQLKIFVDYLKSVRKMFKIQNDNIDEFFEELKDL